MHTDEGDQTSPRTGALRRRRDFHAERVYARVATGGEGLPTAEHSSWLVATGNSSALRRALPLVLLLVVSLTILFRLAEWVTHIPAQASFTEEGLSAVRLLAPKLGRSLPTSLEEAYTSFKSIVSRNSTPTMVVWQTAKDAEIPQNLRQSWDYTKKLNPDYDFRLFDDSAADSFMRTHFEGPTYDAYRSINPVLGAMRADLWRYCVLYIHGGVYLDIDSSIRRPLQMWVGNEAVLGTEGNSWDVAKFNCEGIWSVILNDELPRIVPGGHIFIQWLLIYPLPRHPILWETIRLVTEHINKWEDTILTQNVSSTVEVLCLSGPPPFSVAVQKAFDLVAGGNWTKLHAKLGGKDFDDKAKFRAPGWVFGKKPKGHYTKQMYVPVKVKASAVRPIVHTHHATRDGSVQGGLRVKGWAW